MGPRRRLSIGPLLALLGAVVLLVSLFLDWYDDLTAWTVFEVIDLLLAALAVATVVALLERLEAFGRPARGIRDGATLAIALAALVTVVVQVVNHPPAAIDRDPEIGLWLGLGGSALMVLGTLLSTARISVAVDVQRRDEAPTVARSEPAPAATPKPPPRPGPGV
jgi:hypothetical protein